MQYLRNEITGCGKEAYRDTAAIVFFETVSPEKVQGY